MENTYVFIKGIDGESLEVGHPKWIPVKTITWDVKRTLDMTDLGTAQRGYANTAFNQIKMTSELSLHSTKLMLSVADGTPHKEIKIEMCRAGDSKGKGMEPYLIFKLSDSVIDEYEVSGGEEQIPEETWSIAYRHISIEYLKADPKTGALSKGGTFDWDVMTGQQGSA